MGHPYGTNGQMTMTVHNYMPRKFHRTSNRENLSSGYNLQRYGFRKSGSRLPARPTGPWRQYPSSPEGWEVKRCDRHTDRRTDGETDRKKEVFLRAAWSQLKIESSLSKITRLVAAIKSLRFALLPIVKWSRMIYSTLGYPFAHPGKKHNAPFCYLRGKCSFWLISPIFMRISSQI